jgi:hypothetical protein
MAACTLFLSFSLVFAACGPRITNANLEVVEQQRLELEKLGKGISPKEVESILGQPTRSESGRLPLETQKKEVEVARYFYEQDGETLVLHFVDGKLISPVPKFGATPALPPSGPSQRDTP